MSLLESALGTVSMPGPMCGLGKLISDHPDRADEIRELLEAAPARVRYTVVADTLSAAFDKRFTDDTVSRHVRGKCSCAARAVQ